VKVAEDDGRVLLPAIFSNACLEIAGDNRKCVAANKKARIAAGFNILVFGVGNYTRIIGGWFL
jgi:hypothetical protein